MIRKEGLIAMLAAISFQSYCAELSLEQALRMAEKKNPTVEKNKLEIEVSGLEYEKRRKDFLPTINLRGEEDFVTTDPDEFGDQDLNPDGVGPVSITLSMPIYTGGELTGLLEQARIERERVQLQDTNISLEVRQLIIDSFFRILNLRRQIEISESVIKTLEKQKDRLDKLFDRARLIPKSEIFKVETDIITNKTLKLRRENELEVEKDNLNVLIGMPLDEEFEILEFDVPSLDIGKYNLEKDIERALKIGSRAKLENLLLEDAENNIKLAKVNLYPKVAFDAGYSLKYQREPSNNWPDEWSATLSATWTLFNWGRDLDEVQQSEYRKEQAQIGYRENMDRITLDIRTKYIEMQTLKEELDAQRSKVEITRENLRIDTLRYDNGIIDSSDYLNSVDDLQQAEETYYSLQKNLVAAVDQYESSLK